jgi:23S rRNA (pseudouridine1915-N3)-methyltransferase
MGCREAVFAIGGADGHHSSLLDRADLRLAFGRQTWPHMLFRAMLTEQLYRAEMILANHPYHHA